MSVARGALAVVRARPGRALLAAAGVFAAAALLGTAVTVSFALATGFDRAADRAGLPDVVVRFGDERLGEVDRRLQALPNLEARSYRLEAKDVPSRPAATRGSARPWSSWAADGAATRWSKGATWRAPARW